MNIHRKMSVVRLDPDLLLAWGIVAFIAFAGVVAVGFYAMAVASVTIEPAAMAQSSRGY